jgi:hypothetical protein
MEQGIVTVKAKVLSGPRPGERRRSNGRVRAIETVKCLTDKGEIAVFEVGEIEPPAVDSNVEIRGYAKIQDWLGSQSGRTGRSIYISDVLSVKPANIAEKVFELKTVSEFVQVLGAPVTASVD